MGAKLVVGEIVVTVPSQFCGLHSINANHWEALQNNIVMVGSTSAHQDQSKLFNFSASHSTNLLVGSSGSKAAATFASINHQHPP